MEDVVDQALLERLGKERRFEERTLEIAKRLFVHQHAAKRVALEFGVHLQRVYAIKREILTAAKGLPPGWIEVTLSGPKPLIERLQRQLEQELAKERTNGG